jgi:hypothetical protein
MSTKSLSHVKFEYFRDKLGVVEKTSLERGSDVDDTIVS